MSGSLIDRADRDRKRAREEAGCREIEAKGFPGKAKTKPSTSLPPLDLAVIRYLVVTEVSSAAFRNPPFYNLDSGCLPLIDAHDRARVVADIVDHVHSRIVQVIAFGGGACRDVSREIAGEVAAEMAKRIARDPECGADVDQHVIDFIAANGFTPPVPYGEVAW